MLKARRLLPYSTTDERSSLLLLFAVVVAAAAAATCLGCLFVLVLLLLRVTSWFGFIIIKLIFTSAENASLDVSSIQSFVLFGLELKFLWASEFVKL